METSEEKKNAEYLVKQFEYAGIPGVTEKVVEAALVQAKKAHLEYEKKGVPEEKRERSAIEHTLYVNGEGKYVDKNEPHVDKMELSLILRYSADKDWTYFNRYTAAVNIGENKPLNIGIPVSFRNTVTPAQVHILVKNDSSLERKFYDREKDLTYTAWAYVDTKKPDQDGNATIRRARDADPDAILKSSYVKNIDNIFQRATIKDRFRKGERYEAVVQMGGKEMEVLLNYKAESNSIVYLDKNGKAMWDKLQNQPGESVSDNATKEREHLAKGQSTANKQSAAAQGDAKKKPDTKKTTPKKTTRKVRA